jgi:hypothetical protein
MKRTWHKLRPGTMIRAFTGVVTTCGSARNCFRSFCSRILDRKARRSVLGHKSPTSSYVLRRYYIRFVVGHPKSFSFIPRSHVDESATCKEDIHFTLPSSLIIILFDSKQDSVLRRLTTIVTRLSVYTSLYNTNHILIRLIRVYTTGTFQNILEKFHISMFRDVVNE